MAALPTSGDRRGSKRALAPLWVMAASFFIPAYRACSDEPLRSAAQYASDGWSEAAWVTPVYLAALAFAVLTTLALKRGEVTRALRKLGLATVGLFALASLGFSVAALVGEPDEWQWLAVSAVALPLAALAVRRARGKAPWQVWEQLLVAFLVIAASTAPSIFLGGDVLSGGHSTGPGAWLFLSAQAVLWAVLGLAWVRARRSAAR